MKRIIIILVSFFIAFQLLGQSGIQNQGGIIKVDEGASIKITGNNADFTNLEEGRVDLDGLIYLDGNWFNDSGGDPVFININGIGSVKFGGSSSQNIGGSNYTLFENLYLNNSSGVTLGYFTQVDSILSLTNTILDLDAYDLQMGAINNLTGSFGVSNMIVSNNGGYFKFRPKLGSYMTIPLGDNSGTNEYSRLYFYLYSSTVLGNNALISTRVTNSKHPSNTSTVNYLNRYWEMDTSDITNLYSNVYAFYNDADVFGVENSLSTGRFEDPFWKPGSSISTTGNYIGFYYLNEYGGFTAGEAYLFTTSIAISNESIINEAAENGDSILITLTNGTFVSNPNIANWQFYNLPSGVLVGSIAYISDDKVRLYLAGNRTSDYDANITDIEVYVNSNDVNNLSSGWISNNSGVTIVANLDVESLAMADDGSIVEGSENGEIIALTLSGGTFSETLNTASWVLNNLPTGVNYTINRDNSTSVSITLTSNTNIDYDSDITNFEIIIPESDIDDHSGSDLTVSTGVTFTAVVESYTITMGMGAAPISEASEDGEVIWVKLSQDTFVASLDSANWMVSNLPEGVSWNNLTRSVVDDSTAYISLTGNRTIDYDNDISNISITIKTAEIVTYTGNIIVSSGVTLTANDDNELVTLTSATINEGNEDGSVITVNLAGGTFFETLDKEKWIIGNLPAGVSVGSVTYENATQATLILTGDASVDYDTNIDFNLSISKTQLSDISDALSGAGQLDFVANSDIESIAISGSITEGAEDGDTLIVKLFGGTFISPLNESYFTVSNLPTGVEVQQINYYDSSQVNIILTGNASADYDDDITNTSVLVSEYAFNDSDGDISDDSGVTFIATDEPAVISLSAPTIIESSENGAILTATLEQDNFAALEFNMNFFVHNLPTGVSMGSYSWTSNELEIILSGNREIDFDSNIDAVYVEVMADGLAHHDYGIKSDSILISATNDPENLYLVSQTINELDEEGSVITIVLNGGTFASTLTQANWDISNGPDGVSIDSLFRKSFDTVELTLLGNANVDYDSDILLGITINADEIDDYSGATVELFDGVTFKAVLEPISMVLSNNGDLVINEGAEDGAEILVSLNNDEFITTLNSSDWSVSYLPIGVSIDTLIRSDNTHVIIRLAGNTIYDYDQNIDSVKVSIQGTQFVNQNVNLTVDNGILLTANNDDESISFTTISINEREENASEIEVNLSGGTFVESLDILSWSISGQPSGVSLESVSLITTQKAKILLTGNSDTDYDIDITSFGVTIQANQIDDCSDIDGEVSVSSGVTFKALNESVNIYFPLGSLNEDNVNEAQVELTLIGDAFVDFGLDVSNFILNNAPLGLTIGAIEYVNENRANIMLSFDRTDFDIDYSNVSITVVANEIESGSDLITTTFSITAIVELPYVFLTDNGIVEGSEELGYITVSLYEDEFKASLSPSNWTLGNLPYGVTLSSLVRIDSVTVYIILQGSRVYDYDQDLVNTSVSIHASELVEGLSDVYASSGVIFIAFNDEELITLNNLVVAEGQENGQVGTINIVGGTFAPIVEPETWIFENLPIGVTVTGINIIDSVTASFLFSGARTSDYDNDITDFKVTIPATNIDDILSGSISVNSGITFEANDEFISTVDVTINEANLNGASITLSLTNDYFLDNLIDITSVGIINSPLGLSIESVAYKNDTALSVFFAYDNHDIDENFIIQLQIIEQELFGVADLISNDIVLAAINDDEEIVVSSDIDGIYEGEEMGEVLVVNLTGGTFNNPISDAEWVISGLPSGVSYVLSYISQSEIQIELLSNTNIDYDEDINSLSITIPSKDVSDYNGSDFVLSGGSVSFIAYIEEMTISASLSETNLSGNSLAVSLSSEKFLDAFLANENFILNNAPYGLTISSVTYISDTEATIMLAYDMTDFDADVDNFYVTILSSEIRGNSDLESNLLSITSVVELEDITISHSGLTETNLDGEIIFLETSFVKFVDTNLDINNFTINDAPQGCKIKAITYLTDSSANVEFEFNNQDFDENRELSITVLSTELTVSSSITSNILLVEAISDNEVVSLLSDGIVTEALENGELITVLLEGGDFVDSPNFSNWNVVNLPEGVIADNFSVLNDTAIQFSLSGARIQDFDVDLSIGIIIPAADVNESNDEIVSTIEFIIYAVNDPEVITMYDDGEILEGSENGEEIIVTIEGGTFENTLKQKGFIITNLPAGVAIDEIVLNSTTELSIKLTGNSTVDYDGNINAALDISSDNINDYNGESLQINEGATFIGNYELDDRILNASADGLAEDNLSGYIINLTIEHDKFVDETILLSSFVLNNVPTGVAIESVTYINENRAELILSYDGSDFDIDVTNFFIEIIESELVSGVSLVSEYITIMAIDESPTLHVLHPGLNELNLNGAELNLSLGYDSFVDETVSLSSIMLNNAPSGLTISAFNYLSATTGTLVLSFDGTNFDADISNFSLTVDLSELESGTELTSNMLNILSADENGSLIASVSKQMTENNLNGFSVKLQLVGETFVDNNIALSSILLSDFPKGISIESVSYIENQEIDVSLAFAGNDFDSNFDAVKFQVDALELTGIESFISNSLSIESVDDLESLNLATPTDISEGNEDGANIKVTIAGGTFVETITPSLWSLTNLPAGVIIDTVELISLNQAQIILSGHSSIDYDESIESILILEESQLDDFSGVSISSANSVVFDAIVELPSVSITSLELMESNLHGKLVDLKLIEMQFLTSNLLTSHFTILNGPTGLTVSEVVYFSEKMVQLQLSFDSTDFDVDEIISIEVAQEVLTIEESIVSNTLLIAANNDEETFVMMDDGEIMEGFENGEIITLKLSGGQFEDILLLENWNFNNLPIGVTIARLERISDTLVEFTLAGNAIVDYDTNLTQFEISVPDVAFNDYSGSSIKVKEGVTFIALLEGGELKISSNELNEVTINGAILTMVLTEGQFANPAKILDGIVLNNAPLGLDAELFSILNDSAATLTLVYTGNDFDVDYTNFSVTLTSAYHNSGDDLTSNTLAIFASIEPIAVVNFDGEIIEGQESGELIEITLQEGVFAANVLIDSFNISNLPENITLSNLQRLSDSMVSFTLQNNRAIDYDADLSGFVLIINSGVFGSYYGNAITVETDIVFRAYKEQLIIKHPGLNEGNLNGAAIELALVEDYFVNTQLLNSAITLNNAPFGTSVGSVNYINDTAAILNLAFDESNFASTISNFFIDLSSSELYGVSDLVSNQLTIEEGVGVVDQKLLNLKIYSNSDLIFIKLDEELVNFSYSNVLIFDIKGKQVYNSGLEKLELNEIRLNVLTGNYLVKVNIDGRIFVQKVFILPD